MNPWELWQPVKDLPFRKPPRATPGSLLFKRANLIKQISRAMPQSATPIIGLAGLDRKQRIHTVQSACQGKYKHFHFEFIHNVL